MFYSRFRKSKDLSNYSTTDLASILGTNERRPERHRAADADTTSEEEEDRSRATSPTATGLPTLDSSDGAAASPRPAVPVVQAGIPTITRTETVQEYFARMLGMSISRGGAPLAMDPDSRFLAVL